MQERLIEYEERAANETQTVPVEGLDEQGFRELSAVDKALRKIRQGGYGICELCGQEIEVKRLQSIPDAERCLNCAPQKVPMFERASEEEEEPAGQTALPPNLTGMEDGECCCR
jgi:RNA polymerase-binding transcription factor DksA